MALKGIKANTQKQEIEDKPQTNGKYKIRQVIPKSKEHIHTHKKNQNSTKKKESTRVTW